MVEAILDILKSIAGLFLSVCALVVIAIIFTGIDKVNSRLRRLLNDRPLEHLRIWLGKGLSVAELARRLDITERELRTTPIRYRQISIPKRRGGTRTLCVPDDTLKQIQRRILRRLLAKLRTHIAVTGFERGQSIVTNAMHHVGQAVVIKLDIIDFFPSTSSERVDAYFRRVGWNAEAAKLLTELTTWEGGLPQGAPTSPRLSNLVNYGFDHHIFRSIAPHKGAYTRYADDITISFSKDYPRHIRGAIQRVGRICRAHGYRLHKRRKLRVLRAHQQQKVTGLVVNEKIQLSRSTRRRLRAIRHRLKIGRQATLTEAQLAGWDALQQMIRIQSAG